MCFWIWDLVGQEGVLGTKPDWCLLVEVKEE